MSNNKEKASNVQGQAETPSSGNDFTLHSVLQTVEGSFVSMKQAYIENRDQFKKSEMYQSWRSFKTSTHQNFCMPLSQVYTRMPERITDIKFDMINGYTYGERLMAVNTLGLITGIMAFRRFQLSNALGTSLRAVKSTAVVYLLSGLIIAPQIYNPIMKAAQ